MKTNKSQKIQEVLAVLKVLFTCTSETRILKQNEIISIAKEKFNVDIERRRCADILNALSDLSKDSDKSKVLPFKIGEKGKIYRKNFVLSDDDIDLIADALNDSALLSDNENKRLHDDLSKLLSAGHEELKLERQKKNAEALSEFRNLKNITKKTGKGACLFKIDFNELIPGRYCFYPEITPGEIRWMTLKGFVLDIIECYDEAHVCLLVDLTNEYRVLMILPATKVHRSIPKDDWGLEDKKLDVRFKYGNSKNYSDAYKFIEEYKKSHCKPLYDFEIKYKKDDLITESRERMVSEALKKFYPSQYAKMEFVGKDDGYVYVKFKSTEDHFFSFLLSNFKLLGTIGVVEPFGLNNYLSIYGELMDKNNSLEPFLKFSYCPQTTSEINNFVHALEFILQLCKENESSYESSMASASEGSQKERAEAFKRIMGALSDLIIIAERNL